jgi:hypothetical protein
MLFKLIKKYLIFLIITNVFIVNVVFASIHITYDGKPVQAYNGEHKKYFRLVNNSEFVEKINIRIDHLVNVETDIDYVREYSAVPWLSVSTTSLMMQPNSKDYFYVNIKPFPFLKKPEYYANVLVSSRYEKNEYPLIIRLEEIDYSDLDYQVESYYVTENTSFVIYYENFNEFHNVFDVSMIYQTDKEKQRDNVFNNKILLPEEMLVYKVFAESIATHSNVICEVQVNNRFKKLLVLKDKGLKSE